MYLEYQYQPLPSHATEPSSPSVNMVFAEEDPCDPSQLIAPPSSIVCVRIVKSDILLVVPLNFLSTNPFIIGGPTSVSPQSLSQRMGKLTISFGPQPAVKPVLLSYEE